MKTNNEPELVIRKCKVIGSYRSIVGALKSVFKYTVIDSIEAIEASKVFKAIDALNLTIPTFIK
jgi:type III secretory pathway component EscU